SLRDPLVADAAAVRSPDLVEAQVVVLGGGVETYGHVDQPERHGTLPDRSHTPQDGPMRPMLATPGDPGAGPPAGEGWVHEIKWDGVRLLAEVRDGRLRLL